MSESYKKFSKAELIDSLVSADQMYEKLQNRCRKLEADAIDAARMALAARQEVEQANRQADEAGKFAADQHRRVKELEADNARLRADFAMQKDINRTQAERAAKTEAELIRHRRALSIIADTANLFEA